MSTIIVALTTLWRLVGWRGLLLAGLIASGAWWHLSRVSAAYERGEQSVRLEWAEARQRAETEQARKLQRQQDQIDAAEAALVDAQAVAAIRQAELDAAIAQQEADDAKNTTGDDGAAAVPACPPIPERVRNALNAIGR